MKKRGTLKKFLSLALSSVMLISMLSTAAVSAEESEEDHEPELYLISETETVLEDGTIMTQRYYYDSPDVGIDPCTLTVSSDGHTAKSEIKFSQSSTVDLITIWVQAKFYWDSDKKEATVDSTTIKTGYTIHGQSLVYRDQKTEYANNQGSEVILGLGHKYAYVKYYVCLHSNFNTNNTTYSVYLDMNTTGTASEKGETKKGLI